MLFKDFQAWIFHEKALNFLKFCCFVSKLAWKKMKNWTKFKQIKAFLLESTTKRNFPLLLVVCSLMISLLSWFRFRSSSTAKRDPTWTRTHRSPRRIIKSWSLDWRALTSFRAMGTSRRCDDVDGPEDRGVRTNGYNVPNRKKEKTQHKPSVINLIKWQFSSSAFRLFSEFGVLLLRERRASSSYGRMLVTHCFIEVFLDRTNCPNDHQQW